MTTITLQAYLARIEQLIEDSQFSEAIGHCRNILETYPRHIETYRLLAKALLEQHEYDDATDMFQRVLSADPNDFISHVGMSMIRSESSQLDQSLWHLKRAFEIEPYNAAIQNELRRHYAQYSDLAVDRIPLTSGALARLYIKGELYQQAVQELRQVLKDENDRVDLEVLLAEALWRNDQRIDAEEICLDVLQKLPNCIVINAILSEIWLQTGRIGESKKYLQRLQQLTNLDKASLDLDTAVGQAFYADGAPALPEEIKLEFKGDYEPAGDAAPATKGPSAEWMSEVSFDSDLSQEFEYSSEPGIVTETESGMHSYDWIADVNADLAAADEEIPKPETEWFMDDSLADDAPDDWLVDIDEEIPEGDTTLEDEFRRLFEEEDSAEETVIAAESDADWFQAGADLTAEESLAADQEVPGWLNDLIDEQVTSDMGEEFEPAATMNSDWFADAADSETGTAGRTGESDWPGEDVAEDGWELPVEETPDWLQAMTSEDAAGAEPDVEFDDSFADSEEETAATSDVPDWLVEHASDFESTLEEEEEAVAFQEGGGLTDWLKEAVDQAEDSEAQEVSEEAELTSWPEEITDEPSDVPSGMIAAAAAATLEGADEDSVDTDDYLTGFSEGESVFQTDELAEVMESVEDWLEDLSEAEAGVEIEEEQTDSADTAVALDELSDMSVEELTPTPDGLDSDWLAAPDEELFKGFTDGEEPAAESEPFPEVVPDEAVAAGQEIPDWLLGAELEEGSMKEAAVTGDKEDKEEKQPEPAFNAADLDDPDADWLSELSADAEPELDEDEALFAEDMAAPDWLAADDATAGEAPTPKQPPAAEADEDLLDLLDEAVESAEWLSDLAPDEEDLSAEEPIKALEPEEGPDEGGLTSWLSKMSEDEADTIDEASLEAVEADGGSGETGLTSWLSKMSEDGEDVAATELSDLEALEAEEEFSEGGLTAWLSDAPEELIEDEAVEPLPAEEDEIVWDADEGGLTDWLSDVPDSAIDEITAEEISAVEPVLASKPDDDLIDDIPDIPSEDLFATDEENLPEWLSDKQADVADIAVEEADLPEWLSNIEEAPSDLPPPLDSEDLLDSDGLSELGDDLFEGLADEPDTAVAEPSTPVQEVEEETGLTSASLTALLSDVEEESSAFADLDLDVGVDWLDDMTSVAEEDLEESEAETVADDLGLDWLAEEESKASTPMMDDQGETAVTGEEEADFVDIGVDGSLEDLDDAMSWLEDLASQQETPVDDMPTVAEDLIEAELGQFETIEQEEDLVTEGEEVGEAEPEPAAGEEAEESWLEVLLEEEEELAEAEPAVEMTEEEQAEAELSEPPEDIEDAMVWLEGLAAKQGAPVEELPSQQEEWDTAVDSEGFSEFDAHLDDTMSWLEDMQAEPEEPEEETDPELAEALGFLDAQLFAEGITPTVEDGLLPVSDEELAEALDWLESSAAAIPEEAAPEPEVTEAVVDQSDAEVELEIPAEADDLGETAVVEEEEEGELDIFDMPDDPESAIAWLETMAEEDEAIEIDMQPPPITPSEDAAFSDIDYGGPSVVDDLETAVPEAEEEVEEEILAVELDEVEATVVEPEVVEADLPAGRAEELSSEADIDLFDMPDDPDEAMNWLEAMAAGEGEIEFDMQPPPITPSEDAAFTDIDYGGSVQEEVAEVAPEPELIEEVEPAPVETEAESEPVVLETETPVVEESKVDVEDYDMFDMPEDPDEAMNWLVQMAAGESEIEFEIEPPPITPSEDAAFTDIDYGGELTETESSTAVEEAQPAEDILDKVPEDPDEAMAWLEKIAAQQTSELEEEIGDLPIDTPVPAWLQAEAEEEPDMPDLSEIAGAEREDDSLDIIENLGVDIDDDLSDSLPDWLSMDAQTSPTPDQTGWLSSTEEIDVSSWLAAEEEVTGTEVDADIIIPDTGEIARKKSTGPLPDIPSQTSDLPAESPEVKATGTEEAPQTDDSQLSLARAALENARYEEAVGQYQQLIVSSGGTMALINELEGVADNYPEQPAFRRLLGDAYMRNGQLQKALNTYREALDHL